MKKIRLRTVALSLMFLFTACAHQQENRVVDQERSVSWPMIPYTDKESDREPASLNTGLTTEAIKNPTVVPQPQADLIVNSQSFLKKAPTKVLPVAIKIPKAKNLDDDGELGEIRTPTDTPLIFDIPVAYNSRVKYWIEFFQTTGRPWYTKWLERAPRYLPVLQKTLKRNGLPQDLAYIAMIESGFSSQASSAAKAVGPWQFIRETGQRYGLKVTWWLDERRDFQKSTDAAAKYFKKLYGTFHNWYLVAASYNTGENRIKRLVQKNGTRNFWKIAQKEGLLDETRDYVPKLIAALLIAKSPGLYGFHHINYNSPLMFEHFRVPGGTRLDSLADAIGVTPKHLQDLNPELVRGYVPNYVDGHMIRIPKGSTQLVSHFIRKEFVSER